MNEPTRVLVVAAPDEAARVVEALEGEGLAAEAAHGLADGLGRLGSEGVDCVVSGYDLPERDGIALLERVREDHPDLPFVLLADDGSEAVASEAIAAGVTDYVPRDAVEDGGTDGSPASSEGASENELPALAGRVRDAVERARVDRAVRATETWYRTLLEHSTDYLFVVDPTGRVAYVSPAVREVLGYEPDALVGTQAFEFVHPDDREQALQALGGVIEDPGETRTVEFRAEHADGGYRWLEVRGRNLLDDPVVEGVLVNVRDVTERKRQEQELERQRDRLGDLASVLSHDLRNPLAVAMGNLDAAMDDGDDGDDGELAAVWRALERMDELIETALTMARLGEAVTETEPFWLSALAEECWRNVATESAALQVASDRVVDGDRGRLKQVLENLFRNALEHATPDEGTASDGAASEGPAVTVRVGVLEDGFYVEDDGPGIPPDRRERVFEPGYSTAESGTGLGLNIVADVVEAHGWTVDVTDGAEGGARFEVTGLGSAT